MKKIICLLLVLCMTMGAAACGSRQQEVSEAPSDTEQSGETSLDETEQEAGDAASEGKETKGDKEAYEFICVVPIGLEYFNICADGVAAADAEFGTKTQVIGSTDPSTIVTEFANYVDAAISSQPDGIMTYCAMETVPPLIEKAEVMGIPFIAIDGDAKDSPRIAYVGTDAYNAGYKTGEIMLDVMGESGKVAILCGSISAEKEMTEIEAFRDAIADYDIEVIALEETNADLATGVVKMQALVQTYPEMTGVLCTSAYDVQAAAKVKEEMELDDLVLVGYDDQEETLNYIRKGTINAIVVQDPYQMGYQSVKLMKQYLDGEVLESDIFDTGTIVVTQENVENYK
ncbi:ribose import binding protein RbsB [Lachnospiraceae bacterium]|nr:ribose import binding protein RbsB [Lachnospiraceae bacterium]